MKNKSRPILFSAPMVRALLAGRKTQTRRPMKVKDIFGKDFSTYSKDGIDALIRHHCPYGQVGDMLWVRESFRLRADQDHKKPSEDWWKSSAWYQADGNCEPSGCAGGSGKLRPSIFMPRWASRLTLKITDLRVERVQDISEPDAMAEGAFHTDYGMHCFHAGKVRDASLCQGSDSSHQRKNGWSMSETTSHKECLGMAKFAFGNTWNKLYNDKNKPQFAWDKNPWVWVVEFEVIEKNVLEVGDEH